MAAAVREYAAGKVEFRNDSGGNVHSVVGKMSFDGSKLADNVHAMMNQIRKMKPQTAKGTVHPQSGFEGIDDAGGISGSGNLTGSETNHEQKSKRSD